MTVLRRSLAEQAAIALAIIGAGLAATGVMLAGANRGVDLPPAFELGPGALFFLGTVPFVLAGGLLVGKRPGNLVGWILLGLGLVWQVHGVAGEFRVLAWSAGSIAPWAAWSWDLLWLPGVALVPVLFATFPEGRLPSPRWRPVPVLLGVAVGLYVAGVGLRPGPLTNTPIDNPLGVPALAGVTPLLEGLGQITFVGAALLSFAAPIARYLRADRVQRYQLKWFVAAAALVITSWMIADGLQAVGVNGPFIASVRTVPLIALPIATAFAVLRYRLYDIDVALNRGLLYAGLAAVLGAIYLAVVVGIGTLVGGRGGASVPLTVVATALAAVAFQPARQRLQTVANRLVYGQRASPYDVLASFTQRMAGTYPTGEAPNAIAQAVVEGLRVARCEVWLRVGRELHAASRWPEADLPVDPFPVPTRDTPLVCPGADRTYAVHHDGRLLGAIGVMAEHGERITAGDDRLLHDLAAAAWLVLDNAQLVSELRSSRQRLITAQDTQRRRTERNLHDGAQQRLLELALTLRRAHQQADGQGAEPAAGTIATAELQLRAALGELRELARGLHPAILTERGLVAALESLAERAPLPVTVTATGLGRYAPPVEATAYFVAAEAVANVIKHAGATSVTITAGTDGSRLVVNVTDDGCGGADPTRPGLTGLADRVGALGGHLLVTSPTASGTQIRMELPCA
jgi:signal transduction histidine kinase